MSNSNDIPMTEEQRDSLEQFIARLVTESKESQAKISSLERLMGEAQHVARKFHDENEQLKAEVRRTNEQIHTLATHKTPTHTKVKPQKPEVFHGNRTEDVEGFLVTLERYLRLSEVPVEQWVDYAASFLRHQADKWYRVRVTTHGERSAFTTDYKTFKEEFLKQFKPMNSVQTARDKITKLRQTGSAVTYTHRFLELKLEITDMSDAEAKDRYIRGLKAHVFQKVRVENPTTLNETIRMAQQFDEAVFNCRQAVGGYSRNPDAMELDVMGEDDQENSEEDSEDEDDTLNLIKGKSRPTKRNSKSVFKKKSSGTRTNYTERVRCMQAGLCFKCKKTGHRIRDCPEWKNLKGRAQ
jgi:hypothetical protein